MAELIDRPLQRAILERLASSYPSEVETTGFNGVGDARAIRVNVAYLEGNGLAQVRWYPARTNPSAHFRAAITEKGLDFMAGDGGLSAILGVVTVKLHEDTLKELIAAKIQASDLPPPDKQRLLDQLRELPGETTKHLLLKLVDAGLENWQKALPLLQNILT